MSAVIHENVVAMLAVRATVRETQHIVRERVFPPSQLDNVIAMVRHLHTTGTILIDLTQGAIGTVRLREEHPVSP